MLQAEQPQHDDPMAYSAPSHLAEVSLLEDDEHTSMLGGDSQGKGRNSDSSLGWRERLERFKQQASAKFDEYTKSPAAGKADVPKQEVTMQDLQKAVDETIEKLTDPLYTQIDFERSLGFVDDIKAWSAAFPAVLPIVVSRIDKRMHTDHPQVTLLALHLIDFLVKNASYLQFHKAVATNPLMDTIAGLAKGSVVPQNTSMVSSYMKRFQDAMPAELKSRERSNSHTQTSSERAASIRAATLKAKEVVKCWGEGFVENQAELPLFHETFQRLMREGVDFGNVEVQGQIAFESTDLRHFAIDEAIPAASTSGAGASETITGANDTVQLYAEVKNGGDAALLEMVTAQVKAQQQELQSVIEISISTGDETTLLSALAAHESLQEALDGKVQDAPTVQEQQRQQSAEAAPAMAPGTKSTVAADLLDLDFLSVPPAPAPTSTQPTFPRAPPAAIPAPAPTMVAAPAPTTSLDPFAPTPAAPPADDDDDDDLFGDLVLTRKQKKGASA